MLDFFMPGAVFKRVMGNGRIKNKFWGFFWREMLLYLAIVFLIIIVLILTVKGITDMPPLNAVLVMLAMLIPCIVMPVIHFKLLYYNLIKNSDDPVVPGDAADKVR